MSQRMALVLAGALTAFVLVVMAGVGATVAVKSLIVTNAANDTQPQAVQPTAVAQPENAVSNPVAVQVSQDQAAQIALRAVPSAKLSRTPELVNLQGAVAYEVVLTQGNVYVDANTGKILLNNAAPSTTSPVRSGERRRESGENHEHEGDNDD